MSKNRNEIPATEIVERALEIARIGSDNDDSRAWGAVNDVYVRDLPYKEDWNFLLASSAMSATAKYDTGTASINTGATAVGFAGATITAGMTGRKIKFSGNDNVYDFTYVSATSGSINIGLSGDQNVSAGAFVIYQPIYALAANFDRFPKNGGLQLWRGGRPTPIPEIQIQGYYEEFTASPGTPNTCRLVSADTAGVPQVELGPPPSKADVYPYDYFQRLAPLRETTQGTCTVNAGSSTATFHAGAKVGEAGTGWFFRIDAFGTGEKSEWYPVLALSAANSTATLQTAFGLSGATSANYTLSMVPQMPILMHKGVLEGTVERLLTDQNDPTFAKVSTDYKMTIAEAKRLFKSRIYNQHVETALEDPLFRR